MTILAIDPGPSQSAYVLWDGKVILECGILDNQNMLRLLEARPRNADVVIERIESYGMAVGREVFETCFWTGRFIGAADAWQAISLVPRREVKLHLCGSARAKDSNIIQALKDRFGGKGTKQKPGMTYHLKADIWQAFALGCTVHDQPELRETYRVE